VKTLRLKLSGNYEIKIAGGLLRRCGDFTAAVKEPCAAVLVSDDIVYRLYGEAVKTSYEKAGFSVAAFVFPNGEGSKNFAAVEKLLEFMASGKITRSGLVIALGGGVVGDLAGFAASIYLRGVAYVQIPTTVMAAVDSSVGGKTGVNLRAGKNLAGAFHQPLAVFCDTETFKTLPQSVFNDGLCEIIKYGCIVDESLFAMLLADGISDNLADIVAACVAIKGRIVMEDEFDLNERRLLNFGHTAGHAIERLSDYKISHGRAVAMGMRIMAQYAGCAEKLLEVFQKYGIDSDCPYTARELAQNAVTDKKRSGETITLVMLEKIGRAHLEKVGINEVEGVFARGLG
jgi:3-dehydroquinate synthase